MNQYLNEKRWNSDLIDALPYVLSQLLTRTIKVLTREQQRTRVSKFGNEFGNPIILLLDANHYRYLKQDSEKLLDLDGSFATSNLPNPCTKKLDKAQKFRKPAFILDFKSDMASKRIVKYKDDLRIADEFNVLFKSTTKLADLAKLCANPCSAIESKLKISEDEPVDDEKAEGIYGSVYLAQCKPCANVGKRSCYIGESGRSLKTRISEHCREIKDHNDMENVSAIGLHDLKTHGTQPLRTNWDFRILKRSSKTSARKILEAAAIQQAHPELNRDKGVTILPLLHDVNLRENLNLNFSKKWIEP